MAQTSFLPDQMGNTERPGVISALGVVSFANTGLFLLIYGLGLLAMAGVRSIPYEEFVSKANEAIGPYLSTMSAEEAATMPDMLELIYNSGALLCGLLLLRTAVRFIGVLGMWKGRRSGFYTYALAQLGGIFLPHLVLPFKYMGFFGPLLAVVFTAIYGTQLKRMG